MTKASLGRFLGGALCVAGLAVSAPVLGQATISISGTTCASWSLTNTGPGAYTLTCNPSVGPGTAPVCTISGLTSGVTGTPVPLFAKCVPEATSYTWTSTGVTCKGAGPATCYANEAAGTYTYTVTGSNGAGTGSVSQGLAVTFAAAPPPAPTGCVFSAKSPASGSLASAGGAISMTATCSGTVTSWNWTKNSAAWANDGATGSSAKADALPANTGAAAVNYSYTAQACNGPSCAAAISTTFSVPAPSGGSGGGSISCPGFAKTTVINVGGNGWAYDDPGHVLMDAGDAVVLVLKVPNQAPSTASGLLTYYDQYQQANNRYITISKTPCQWGVPPPPQYSASGQGYSWFPRVGDSSQTNYGTPLYLDPGATYYVNIQNLTCAPSPYCDLGYAFHPPN